MENHTETFSFTQGVYTYSFEAPIDWAVKLDDALNNDRYFIDESHALVVFPEFKGVYTYTRTERDYEQEWIDFVIANYKPTLESMRQFCGTNISGYSYLTPATQGAIAGAFLVQGNSQYADDWVISKHMLEKFWEADQKYQAADDTAEHRIFMRNVLWSMNGNWGV